MERAAARGGAGGGSGGGGGSKEDRRRDKHKLRGDVHDHRAIQIQAKVRCPPRPKN